MALDIKGYRLFVSAEDNHSLEVINLQNAKPITSIPNLNEPKWLFYWPENNRIYVATGRDGKVTELDGITYNSVQEFVFKEKCNNLRFDSATKQLWVGVGDSFGSLGIIDLVKDKIVGEISLADYPKQFELDGDSIYVNEPRKNLIEVISRAGKKVICSWKIMKTTQNVPMAIDRLHGRLFIGCEPGKFLVYSTKTGKIIQSLDINKKSDGIYLDAKHSLLYISCGEGYIDVVKQIDADHYQLIEKINTAEGAGTSLFSSSLNQFFLAVPQSTHQTAEIRIYQPLN